VSDRASRGDYEDRSGPRLRERLEEFFSGKRWHPEIETRVLPDEARRLTTELRADRDGGVDVIFTTGGTGVGPRDVTPDVVAALADRTIPGIMEHIRVKYGQSNPKALLSRGVAAVLGRTLVYTLPGSVRAVGEYMEEILATLEHTVLMLHGVDAHGSSG
jgi:molybdenum cofactor synthesis domain-containing protein